MYVQSTIFPKHAVLPGEAEVLWQGTGEDRGFTLVRATIDGTDGYYIVERIGSRLTATIYDEDGYTTIEELDSNVQFPYCWWLSSSWVAVPDSYAEPTAWTVIKSNVAGIHPREWQYPYLDSDHQGTTDQTDIQSRWYGDAWFDDTGARRGVLKRFPLEEGDPVPSITITDYSWRGAVCRHTGKGTAPAGYYTYTEQGTEGRNFGYWNDAAQEYTLNPSGVADTELAPVGMFSIGVIRPTEGDPAEDLPTGWDFEGSDWDAPDPYDWRYWWCVRAAILERESVIQCGVDRDMGLLDSDEQTLWDISPYNPVDFDTIDALRRCIVALAGNFVVPLRVVEVLEKDDVPTTANTCVDLTRYTQLMGGWTRGDPINAAALGNLSGFLREARAALEEMTVVTPSRIYHHQRDYGTVCNGDGSTMGAAWHVAMEEYNAYTGQWHNWTAGAWPMSAISSNIMGQSGDTYDTDGDHVYEVLFSWEDVALQSVCFPPTSVIDGEAWGASPRLCYVADSRKPDYKPGDTLQGGVVTEVSWYSAMDIQEGVHAGITTWPLTSTEEPPDNAPQPGTPTQPNKTGWHVWGNTTTWWFFVFFGEAFRFGGPVPQFDDSNS